MVLLSGVGIVLLWHRGPSATDRFYLAALLAALSPLGFLIAWASRRLFRGTLSDPNGVRPLRFKLFGSMRVLDLNLAAVAGALLSLGVILWWFQA